MINGVTLNETKNVQNPLDKGGEPKPIDKLYSDKDKDYLSFIQNRLENARRQKTAIYKELGNKTQQQIFDENEIIANTVLPEKKNDDDVIVSAGTVEGKLDALLANIANLDLDQEVMAFDKENNKIHELGVALKDTMDMTEELDGEGGDEEKKLLRQRELLKQGTVFVQEEWLKKWETKKKLKESYNGQFKDFAGWDEKLELVFEGPSRTLLYGPNVYLGDITEFEMENQPFVCVVIHQSYDLAKTKYGKFENWEYVKKGAVPSTGTTPVTQTIYDNNWRMTTLTENQVEIILYQDQTRDEFQIIINGVMMLPIGFPLSAVSPMGKYNITKQVFRVIHHKFALGKSFVSSGAVKEISALIDEMLKLFVLKTRKSFSRPYVNTSGKVIPKKVLSPGRISMGIPADALQPIGEEGQGVTSNEFGVLKELQDRVDKSTVSNQFAGQQGNANTTATEVLELQRQAKLTLGLTIAACSLLEKKLAYLRLWNILANWFNPVDTKVVTVDGARVEIKKYRNTFRETNIDGEGRGERQIIPTDQPLPSPRVIRDIEIQHEKENGYPVRKVFLNPEELMVAKVRWYIVVTPKEKETSAFYKLLFREELQDLQTMQTFGSVPNKEGIEEEFSRVYQRDKSKFFSKMSAQNIDPSMAGVGGDGQGAPGANKRGVPRAGGAPVPQTA